MQQKITDNIAGSRISVLGAGRSGMAAARLLLRHGAEVFLSEANESEELERSCSSIGHKDFDYELGGHSEQVTAASDLIVISPGIPLDTPVIDTARRKNIKVIGELEITSLFCENRIIAITGTNGKSTTTSMVEAIFHAADLQARAAGNIGVAFADVVDELEQDETVILEVSSYQLETIEHFHPWIAAILNVRPDHLKRHKTMEEYLRCKLRIGENQDEGDLLILNGSDDYLPKCAPTGKAQIRWFNGSGHVETGAGIANDLLCYFDREKITDILHSDQLPVPGQHNIENALAALCAAVDAGIQPEHIAKGLRSFRGLEHRLEFVREVNGIIFINDSKATNADSLAVALNAFTGKKVILIAGGEDKGSSLHALNDLIRERVRALILIGEAAERMSREWGRLSESCITAGGLEEAVSTAFEQADPGDAVLLSPACASFDMFQNYEQRGEFFKQYVERL
ncbi:UDP-N-acetylmuramoyl-L-alanine--D-glutamate ligase [candidate division KSB1 bacterium]